MKGETITDFTTKLLMVVITTYLGNESQSRSKIQNDSKLACYS